MLWLRNLADVVFPPVCRVCRQRAGFPICRICLERFRLITPPWCARCGRPLIETSLSALCRACLVRPPPFSRARPAGVYEGALREAIHALKFGNCRAMAGPLGDVIASTVQMDGRIRADLVVPVPLHPSRYRARGFNQAELLGRRVAPALGLPCDPRLLRRVKMTDLQSRLTRDRRESNVRGAFVCDRSAAGLRILLIDDVMSTGFTASECAGAVSAVGAADVMVATVAAALLF